MPYLLITIGLYLIAVIVIAYEHGIKYTADRAWFIMISVGLCVAAVKFIRDGTANQPQQPVE